MNFELKMLIGSLFLLALVFFSFIYQPGAGLYVAAYEVNETPPNYIEVTMEELDEYPYIKKAVMQPGKEIKVPTKEQMDVTSYRIFRESESDCIKINDTYYCLSLTFAD
ncbi:hypothetical protein [Methanococcoides sp. AM1]|uniref:hypothetical protein n=1 Tax=Methanococcoides sp. AM1 TaxID=1201011 RepID=UPI001083F563|nr:hypothetical protein [Methanococcoides sp. AM1]